jgi:hypothetical protein
MAVVLSLGLLGEAGSSGRPEPAVYAASVSTPDAYSVGPIGHSITNGATTSTVGPVDAATILARWLVA